jgi:hypothetical protein
MPKLRSEVVRIDMGIETALKFAEINHENRVAVQPAPPVRAPQAARSCCPVHSAVGWAVTLK